MKITVLGSGIVGQTISSKLDNLGHQVILGTRNSKETLARLEANRMTGKTFSAWYNDFPNITLQDFGNIPADSDLIINATSGNGTMSALKMLGKSVLTKKVLIDISNPLDFSRGMPPSLSICNTDSLAETIQREYPDTYVVKTLNTMNCSLMVNPSSLTGDHHVFMSGNDNEAKVIVQELLQEIGWKKSSIIDLGGIESARGAEMILPMWLNLFGKFGHGTFNFAINHKNK